MKRVFSILLITVLLLCSACNLEENNRDIYTFLQENEWYESQGIDTAAESEKTTNDTQQTTYVSGYLYAQTIIEAMIATLENAVAVYNNTNYENSVNETYSCFASRRRVLTSTVGSGSQEDWIAAFSSNGYKNVVCENATLENYVFTFDTTSTALVTETNPTGACKGKVVCDYNVKTGAMRYVYTEDDAVIEFFCMSPQSDNLWAFADMFSRAVVLYQDGKVNAVVYGERKNDATEGSPDSRPYSLAENDIFNQTGYSIAWVSGDKENMQRLTTLQDGTFTLERWQRFARSVDPPTYEWVAHDIATTYIGDQWIEFTPEPTLDPEESPSPSAETVPTESASPSANATPGA